MRHMDGAGVSPLAAVMLVGIVLAVAVGVFAIVRSFPKTDEPVLATFAVDACSTSGPWTVSRLTVQGAQGPLRADALRAKDAVTGRSTEGADAPLVLASLRNDLRAGDNVWLTTPRDEPDALDCRAAVQLFHGSSPNVLSTATQRAGETHPLALAEESCVRTAKRTTVVFTLTRVPPDLDAADVHVVDTTTSEFTGPGGHLRLTGGGAPLQAGDVLTLKTQNNRPAQIGCSDALGLTDATSGALLRSMTLAP